MDSNVTESERTKSSSGFTFNNNLYHEYHIDID